MMTSWPRDRRGIGTGDALVVLALLSLAFAVVYPRVVAATFQQEVDSAIYDVETLRAAALAYQEESGSWPAEAPAGTVPAELAPSLPADYALSWEHYQVDWSLWQVVREPAPDSAADVLGSVNPTVGLQPPEVAPERAPEGPTLEELPGISVRTDDEALLAALLRTYGRDRSFVHGPRWTLILPEDE